jgi:putative transposase
MPWKETTVLNQRFEFVQEALKGLMPFSQLCRKYGISERIGYKWKNRFIQFGMSGLSDLSKAPKSTPESLSEDVIIRIVNLRIAHPTWGSKKLAVLYNKAYTDGSCPSISSFQRIFNKAGLVKKRHIKRVCPESHRLRQHIQPKEPNDVWSVDFKGWWFSNHEKCIPLTVCDVASRFILDIRLMQSQSSEAVRAVFTRLFAQYGLPKVIRSDNGTPFAAPNSLLNLTSLSCWWISLGILPDRIDPGRPAQNGSHERMHADLARDIQGKSSDGIAATQASIDLWYQEYNYVRPHEALGMLTPSDIYRQSATTYTGDIDQLEYPPGFLTRKVFANGEILLHGARVSISYALRGFHIGLLPRDSHILSVWLADFPLGCIDLQTYCFQPMEALE